jgi:hypothetical protein
LVVGRALIRKAIDALRRARWGVLVTLTTWVIFWIIFAGTPSTQRPGSDGYYTWLYARSLVFDHDIDFKNDYEICGDPYHKNVDRGTGHPDNPFYAGPSVTWVPVLWTLRHVLILKKDAPEEVKQACVGPLAAGSLAMSPILGGVIVFVMYRLARRHVGDGPAALTAGLLGLCTQLPAYAAIMTSYSHVYDAFWAAMTMLASVRAAERPRSLLRWTLVGVCVGINLLQRPVSVAIGLVPAALAVTTLWRSWGRLVLVLGILGTAAFVFGALPQMLIYRYLYGSLWAGAPHGRFYLQYGHAHPWLVLFAPHGGLFFTAPVLWLAVIGLALGLRKRKTRVLSVAIVLVCAAVVWLSSAALDWHGSGTFGARRLTSLIPLFAMPTALVVGRMHRWVITRPARARVLLGATVLGVGAWVIVGAAGALTRGRISTDNPSSQSDLYGGGGAMFWLILDERVGDVAILPAELVFRLRYGLPMQAFRDATEPRYQRNYRTMDWEATQIDFKDGNNKILTRGFMSDEGGLHPRARRATVVFAAQWPFATTLIVHGRARTPTKVRIGRGTLFGTVWYDDLALGTEMQDASTSIPAGGFDSGILELVFECDLGAEVVIESLKIDDTTHYPPPL